MIVFKWILNFFTFWLVINRKYKKLEQNEEKKEKSIYLGVRSIVQSLICGVLVVLFLWGLQACFSSFSDITAGTSSGGSAILSIIGIVATAIGAVSCFVQGVVGGLLYMVYQFKLNKKGVRWVALAVWILVMIAIVVFACLIFMEIW